jgi:putative Mg2+ transporter-C (MgtC) family protein
MLLSFQQMLVRLVFAAALGAVIGVEREFRRRPAGIRTSMFVCMATALFTMLSGQIAHLWGDSSTTRIASNIVQGIGFLGAGAIMKEGGGLLGMTTAATIFVEAAIGMAVGGGLYALAGSATVIVLFGLVVLGWCSQRLNLKARMLLFRFTTSHAENVAGEVQRLLSGMKILMQQFRVSMVGANSIVEFEAVVSHKQSAEIVAQLSRQGVITEIIPVESHHG